MATHALSLDGYGVPAHSEHDPVLEAILRAPLSQTPETDEERAAFEAVMASIGASHDGGDLQTPSRFVSAEEITATIAAMRREAGE